MRPKSGGWMVAEIAFDNSFRSSGLYPSIFSKGLSLVFWFNDLKRTSGILRSDIFTES